MNKAINSDELKPDHLGQYQVMIDNPEELQSEGVLRLFNERNLSQPSFRIRPRYIFCSYRKKQDAEMFLEAFNFAPYNARLPLPRNIANQKYKKGIGKNGLKSQKDEWQMANGEDPGITENAIDDSNETLELKNDKKKKRRNCCPHCGSYLTKGDLEKSQVTLYDLPEYPSAEKMPEFPCLVLAQDLIDYEKMMKKGVPRMVGVFVTNFPLYFVQGSLYKLCSRFVEVLHVDIRNNMNPTDITTACVYVASEEEASFLKASLHDKVVGGKFLKLFKESEVNYREPTDSSEED